MSSRGIKDQVAIIGMGCTPFGEHFHLSAEDMMVNAAKDAFASAGIEKSQVEAYWLGTAGSGIGGTMLSKALKSDFTPVTRVENFCATGSEAFRNACYAVASGAYDVAAAVGVEKLKDSGYSGLTRVSPAHDGTTPAITAPARFSLLAPAYCEKYGVDRAEFKDVITRIAWKNHYNGARNQRAAFQSEVALETIKASPRVAGDLGIFDCSGVSDGAAAVIVVRAEDAHKYTDKPIYVKALALAAGPGKGALDPDYDYTTFEEVVRSAADAYAQAGITSPRDEISMAEVHDCFTPTELVLMEDLGFSERGKGWRDVQDGVFDLSGDLPVNPDGGLKSFGHPIGASGIRMLFEAWTQLREEAPADRQIAIRGKGLALTQNLGGVPGDCVSFVSVVGRDLG